MTVRPPRPAPKRLALIGAKGMLARKVLQHCPPEWQPLGFDLPDFDLADGDAVRAQLLEARPEVIINCAAYTDVDGCESQTALAERVNGAGPGHLARVARELDAVLLHVSTDYVFDGSRTCPYREDDEPRPGSAYGRSKLLGEEAIRASGLQKYLIVRTSWLYGPGGKNFVATMVKLGRERDELRVVADQVGSPTYTGDLAPALFRLLDAADRGAAPYGIYHVTGEGACSWHAFACAILDEARRAGETIATRVVTPITTSEYPLPAPRPAYSVLSQEKFRRATGTSLPPWRESLGAFFTQDWRQS